MSKRNRTLLLILPALATIVLDQWSKTAIRTQPTLQRLDLIEGWLRFNFTLNPGMALGIEVFPTAVVSSIAILATIGISLYVYRNLAVSTPAYLVCMGFLLGGALGNIIDRIILAKIEGYGGILEGHVVDFIHVYLRINDWPVFPYIFNLADIAISGSILFMIIFHRVVMPVGPSTDAEVVDGAFPNSDGGASGRNNGASSQAD